jgi:hypothetical protein
VCLPTSSQPLPPHLLRDHLVPSTPKMQLASAPSARAATCRPQQAGRRPVRVQAAFKPESVMMAAVTAGSLLVRRGGEMGKQLRAPPASLACCRGSQRARWAATDLEAPCLQAPPALCAVNAALPDCRVRAPLCRSAAVQATPAFAAGLPEGYSSPQGSSTAAIEQQLDALIEQRTGKDLSLTPPAVSVCCARGWRPGGRLWACVLAGCRRHVKHSTARRAP